MLTALVATTVVVAVDPSRATQPDAAPCYDTMVVAKLIRQTPTTMPSCDRCLIMAWPYIDVLDVKRVKDGRVSQGQLTVLSIQHTWKRQPKDDLWWLRRNSNGGYNVIADGRRAPRCRKDEALAHPYVEPPPGQTLGDLEREGDQRYGHMIPGQIVYPNMDGR